jgi:hypothetical protein
MLYIKKTSVMTEKAKKKDLINAQCLLDIGLVILFLGVLKDPKTN